MSFRVRMTIFFALIVVLPMAALAVLVSQIATDSAAGKADARLHAGLRTATHLHQQARQESLRVAREIASRIDGDRAATTALEDADQPVLRNLARIYRERTGAASVTIAGPAGQAVATAGKSPVASASVELVEAGERLGTVTVATLSEAAFLKRIERTTGERAVLAGPAGRISGGMIDLGALPESGESAEVERGGDRLRAGATEPLGEERVRVALLVPAGAEGFFGSRPQLALALLAFFAAAVAAAVLIVRSLQAQVREMLAAARRIGGGDFSRRVPVSGGDEMAGLASEFNKMSDRLSGQMQQLQRQRVEIDKSVRRVGQAFAAGLDRSALLSILVETAVAASDSEYGSVALSGHVGSQAEIGDLDEALKLAALAAERTAMRRSGLCAEELDGCYAISSSLGSIGSSGGPLGAMTVARRGRAFSVTEREVFLYLLGQASASVENLALHELVSEQAVTDELTGLANNRAFRDAMEREFARAMRFGHPLSLLIVDLDDFKLVNDTYGHLQGDEALRATAAVLDAASREIDVPARYGGEEFVVALPETDHEGAVELAERIRARIATEPVAVLDGTGGVRVTASVGVATVPDHAETAEDLLIAADVALYDAKRAGKDRVCSAGEREQPGGTIKSRLGTRPAQGPAPVRRR